MTLHRSASKTADGSLNSGTEIGFKKASRLISAVCVAASTCSAIKWVSTGFGFKERMAQTRYELTKNCSLFSNRIITLLVSDAFARRVSQVRLPWSLTAFSMSFRRLGSQCMRPVSIYLMIEFKYVLLKKSDSCSIRRRFPSHKALIDDS